MTIPHLRVVVPVVAVVIAVGAYLFIAHPFAEDDPFALAQEYRDRATSYLEKGKNKEALELLLKLEELTPKDLAVHYAVARLYQTAGLKAEARAALERGMPYLDDPDANAAYAQLLAELE